MNACFEAFFVDAPHGGQRFVLYHPPHGPARGAVLQVHAFAEEMNKSRRMCAMQSRALACAGYGVLQMDLLGCGDSSGEFADASWTGWLADLALARALLRERCDAPLWWWGQRAGALLAVQGAAQAATSGDDGPHLLFWQPALQGKLVLQQFLRLKAAGEMLNGGGKGVTEELRQKLAAGETVDIAGYGLAPALAEGLEQAQLHPLAGAVRVCWLEISPRNEPALSPAVQAAVVHWSAHSDVQVQLVQGPAFWQTTEVEDAPALLEATLAALAAPMASTATLAHARAAP